MNTNSIFILNIILLKSRLSEALNCPFFVMFGLTENIECLLLQINLRQLEHAYRLASVTFF